MGRYDRYDDDDDEQFWKDLLVVFKHPDFRDAKPTDALGDLYERRRRNRRQRIQNNRQND